MDLYFKLKYRISQDLSINIIHKINCKNCRNSYIGHIKNDLINRIKNHIADSKNNHVQADKIAVATNHLHS